MPTANFTGFGDATLTFLRALARHNQREWFLEHKPAYEQNVVTPALAFISAMEKPLAQLAPRFLALPLKQGGSLMRLHRDVRFSRNKSPYKTNIGMHFRHELARDVHAPGYYVHIQPPEIPGDYETHGCFIGVGIWRPAPDALAAIRQRIAEKPQQWIKARDDASLRKYFALDGDSLRRPPRGYDPQHPCIEDLKRTDFIATHELNDLKLVGSAKLVEHTAKVFAAAKPMMRFLCQALDVAF